MDIQSPQPCPRPQPDRRRWAALRDQTLRLWTSVIGLGGIVLEWRDARSLGLLALHLAVLGGITLSYRELYLQRWAIRLHLAEQAYRDPWSRPHPGADDPPPPDEQRTTVAEPPPARPPRDDDPFEGQLSFDEPAEYRPPPRRK